MMNLKHCRLFAFSALALAPVASFAQTWVSYDKAQDVLLGFREAGQPDLVLDLGSYTTFNSAKTIPFSYLQGVYGSNLDGITWSAFGTIWTSSSDPNWKTVFATDPGTVNGVQVGVTGPWQNQSAALQAGSGTKIYSFGNGLNTAVSASLQNVSVLGSGTALSIVPNATSTDKSYTYLMTHTGTGNFMNTFQGGESVEQTLPAGFSAGSVDQKMDLYQLVPGGTGDATLLGTFDVAPGGTITYTPTPEPSTCALAALGFLGLVGSRWFRRRA
jgi:hypothetical protein